MSEKFDLTGAQKKLAETLKGIGVDLWGTADPDKWAEMAFEESGKEPKTAETRGTGSQASPAKGAKQESAKAAEATQTRKPQVTIENVWKKADITVDWTEALVRESPTDGLTAPGVWRFYHRMARQVLDGDLKAYGEVLKTLNPLGDLRALVGGMIIRTPSAERLECEFECRPELIEKDARLYLGGLSLRIARDLLAVLPVEEVQVIGRMNEEEKVKVTFRREQLMKRKLAFLDPAELVEDCGGKIIGTEV